MIKIDYREKELISICSKLVEGEANPRFKGQEIVVENLDIGDAILSLSGQERIIVERKTIADLASSIKDGRYEEQSFRLNGYPIPNHNIIYIVEGNINDWKYKSIDKPTIYSAIVSLVYYKGFSVLRTVNVEETAYLLCHTIYKLQRGEKEGKIPFYLFSIKEPNEEKEEEMEKGYVSFTKKSANITPNNIGSLMLCQIPGIHSTTAEAIMSKFNNLENLILQLRENPDCLQELSYVTNKGQTRKISKTVLENLKIYLVIKNSK